MSEQVYTLMLCPYCETGQRPSKHTAEECREVLRGQRDLLAAALEKFVEATEKPEDGWECVWEELWNAYAAARKLLGDPVKMYPGGYDGEHFHLFGWKEEDGCETCADYEADRLLAQAQADHPEAKIVSVEWVPPLTPDPFDDPV